MKRNVLTGLSIFLAATLMTACGGGNKTPQTEEVQETALVKTSPAMLQELENNEVFTSNIQAFKENNIAPSLAVRIDQILVDVGARVSQGQLLVRMDPTQYNQTAVQLANAESDYERMRAVYDAGGISTQEMDSFETQLKVQRDQATNLRDNIELRSPISGVVTARNYDPGDLYNGTPILQIMQINNLKVSVNISEQYFPLVKNGMPADIAVDMYPGKVFQGKVSLIYPSVDPATRTFTVEITIPNSNGELRPGMFSRTTLKFGTYEGVTVEDVAVQRQLGTNEKYIYVLENGKAVRRNVTTGIQTGDRLEITSGVNAGEQVITAGFSKLSNGVEVQVTND